MFKAGLKVSAALCSGQPPDRLSQGVAIAPIWESNGKRVNKALGLYLERGIHLGKGAFQTVDRFGDKPLALRCCLEGPVKIFQSGGSCFIAGGVELEANGFRMNTFPCGFPPPPAHATSALAANGHL